MALTSDVRLLYSQSARKKFDRKIFRFFVGLLIFLPDFRIIIIIIVIIIVIIFIIAITNEKLYVGRLILKHHRNYGFSANNIQLSKGLKLNNYKLSIKTTRISVAIHIFFINKF
jgi:hypothetical protein